MVSALLLHLGFSDLRQLHGNICTDIFCTLGGKRVCVEVKDRACSHDRYADTVVEEVKRQATKKRIDRGEFDEALVASVYADGVVVLANLFDPGARLKEAMAPTTTLVKGGPTRYISKVLVSLPQTLKFRVRRGPHGFGFSRI